MNQVQKKIINQFSPELQSHIIEFCKEISNIQCDVFILLARKAACFVSVLEDIGFLHLHGKVVSERVLDYDTSWLKGKDIVIIDDTVISGTSIFQIVNDLEKIGANQVRVQVFCVNEYWFVPELLEASNKQTYLQQPYLSLDHNASLKFCRDIVKALSIYPRPYSTDFPIYQGVRLSEYNFHKIQSNNEWRVADTTSKEQLENEIRCFTMNPTKDYLQEFYRTIGVNLVDCSYLKLRVYTQFRDEPNQDSYYLCRILPLVIFEPVSNDFLDTMISAICEAEITEKGFVNFHLKSNKSKLRFIQFYFASRFFKYCVDDFKRYFNKNLKYVSNSREVDLIFPPKLVEILQTFRYEGQLKLENRLLVNNIGKINDDVEEKRALINPMEIKDLLVNEFLKLYYDKELVARRIVKIEKKAAFEKTEYKSIINRLNEGFTFGDLENIIAGKVANRIDQQMLISNFLDNAIDSGIIVPVTLETCGLTSRGYRHGEEVIWGENNDKLLSVFLETFLKKTNAVDFGHFLFEKLLVLFLKMGLKVKALEEYNYLSPPPTTMSLLGVRTYLFGEITVVYELQPMGTTKFNPILDYETKGNWTSAKLIELGVIKENEQNRYEIDFETQLSLSTTSKLIDEPEDVEENLIDTVEEIAELLALARNEKILDNEGLVLLTSCLTLHDCLSSIAAELNIYQSNIDKIGVWLKSALSRDTFTLPFLANLRDAKYNIAWTGINSGQDKYNKFKNNAGDVLVKKISDHFGTLDSFKKRSWDKYWKKEIEKDGKESPELHQLNNEMGLALIEINSQMIYLNEIIYEKLCRNGEIDARINQRQLNIRSLEQEIANLQEKINKNVPEKAENAQGMIDFKNAPAIKKLQSELETSRLKILNLKKDINYWSEYHAANIDRITENVKECRKLTTALSPISNILTNISTGYLSSLSDEALSKELEGCHQVIRQYKIRCQDLLVGFSALVPQWGKINPVVKYNCLIHINTEDENIINRKKLAAIVKKVVSEMELDELKEDALAKRSMVLLRPRQSTEKIGYFIGGKGRYKSERMLKLASKLLFDCSESEIQFKISYFPSVEDKNSVRAFFNKTTGFFDEVHENFQQPLLDLESQSLDINNALIVYDGNEDRRVEIRRIAENVTKTTVKVLTLAYKDLVGQASNKYSVTINHKTKIELITIGVITALPREFAAMKVTLDKIDIGFKKNNDDPNDYVRGFINNKKGEQVAVIVALMKEMGTNNAATTANNMIRSYPEIEDIIMCGIAGGVPDPENASNHVRLGDIVVTNREGILQYDNIKQDSKEIKIRSNTSKPSATLIGLCNLLEAERFSRKTPWNEYIEKYQTSLLKATRPDAGQDILIIGGKIITHPLDEERVENLPKVHFGPVGSANTLLKDEIKRDYLRDNYSVKAIEMEISGVADGTWAFSKGYLTVRGIVDYCNDDKNKVWQNYAALCAASYTKCIIEQL